MRRHLIASLLASVAGCYEHGRSPAADASIDARPDALPRPRNDPGQGPHEQPFVETFGTPAGTFEARHLFASAIWGDCNPPFWELKFTSLDGIDTTVTLHITMPPYTGVEVSGTLPASAYYQSSQPLVSHGTQSATFDATRIDYPADGAPRITGRFLVTDPAWTIDVNLDVLGLSSFCI
jgi:hypothetical protein